METKETIENVLLNCRHMIQTQHTIIGAKIKKEYTLKVIEGSFNYIDGLKDLQEAFKIVLGLIDAFDQSQEKEFAIDSIREKLRTLWLHYKLCGDYAPEKKLLEALSKHLEPFISPFQKQFEKTMYNNISGTLNYDSTRLNFRTLKENVENHMELSRSLKDFSDAMAKNHQRLEQIFKNLSIYTELISKVKKAHQFHLFSLRFFREKEDFFQLAKKLNAYITHFEMDFLEEKNQTKPKTKAKPKPTTSSLSSPITANEGSEQKEKEEQICELTEEESIEQLLAIFPQRKSIRPPAQATVIPKSKKPKEVKLFHESAITWKERRLDGLARLVHRVLLANHHTPGSVSVTIHPLTTTLLFSTAKNLEPGIISETLSKINQATCKLADRLHSETTTLEKYIINKTSRLKDLILQLKDPRCHLSYESQCGQPSEFNKFIFLVKNIRMDLDLAKYLQGRSEVHHRYFNDLHQAISQNRYKVIDNPAFFHPEQAITEALFMSAQSKLEIYIGSTIKNCKKCHLLFNGHRSIGINGLNQSSSYVKVKTAGFYNYGYPNTYLPAYTKRLNNSHDDRELRNQLDKASPNRASTADPRALFIAQQPVLSESEGEAELPVQIINIKSNRKKKKKKKLLSVHHATA